MTLSVTLYFNAAKHAGSVQDQHFIWVQLHAADLSFIIHAAEYGYHITLHIPGRRDNQFGASKNIGRINLDPSLKIRLGQVDFRPPHKTYNVAAPEIFAQDIFFYATKYGGNIQEVAPVNGIRFGVHTAGGCVNSQVIPPVVPVTPVPPAPLTPVRFKNEHEANAQDDEGPNKPVEFQRRIHFIQKHQKAKQHDQDPESSTEPVADTTE